MRLLQVQTRQAAAVLSGSTTVAEQPMRAALDLQAFDLRREDALLFERGFGPHVGTGDEPFVSASLWHREPRHIRSVATLGVKPGMKGGAKQAFLERALEQSTSVVERVVVGEQVRIAFAVADPDTGYVVYAERPIPSDRRARVDQDSAFADLDYALYLGDSTKLGDLSTTNVDPADLPLEGITSRTTVPFGDTVLTLVTSPGRHLGSPLSQLLPIALAIGGLLLTAVATLVVRGLVRARREAESNTETITALYQRGDDLYEQQRELFVRLQRALLPQVIPSIPQFEIASRYVAGAQGVDIGGDWYSVIDVDQHQFAFVVGDVSGHGVDAVAAMAHARFTVRAYLVDGDSPQRALEKCSRQFDVSTDDHMITVIVGIGNWVTGEIVLASAGHPPPLLITAEKIEYVRTPVGPPLGVGPSLYEQETFAMPAGATLISYTDGLIERRTEDIDTGLRRLVDVVAPIAHDRLEDLIDQALASLRDEDAADDIAVLALRRGGPMKTSFAADVSAPRKARSYLATQLDATSLPTGVTLDKILLTASELVTNAVQADATNIEISVHVAERRLDLVVSDDAEGWPTPVRAAAHDTAGRGLTIVEQLADSWDVGPRRDGKAVTVTWLDRTNQRIDSGS